MVAQSFGNEGLIKEARRYIERALGGISTLHLEPLDYNVFTTADALRAAALTIEEFGRRKSGEAARKARKCSAPDEASCAEPFNWDDNVPYCDTCGVFRQSKVRP